MKLMNITVFKNIFKAGTVRLLMKVWFYLSIKNKSPILGFPWLKFPSIWDWLTHSCTVLRPWAVKCPGKGARFSISDFPKPWLIHSRGIIATQWWLTGWPLRLTAMTHFNQPLVVDSVAMISQLAGTMLSLARKTCLRKAHWLTQEFCPSHISVGPHSYSPRKYQEMNRNEQNRFFKESQERLNVAITSTHMLSVSPCMVCLLLFTIAYLCMDNFLGSLLVDVPSTEQVSMKIIVQTYFWASMSVFLALSGKVLWEGLVCKPSTLKQTIKYNPSHRWFTWKWWFS